MREMTIYTRTFQKGIKAVTEGMEAIASVTSVNIVTGHKGNEQGVWRQLPL